MAGTGPLNSENITGLLENLDKALDDVGGRAELYLDSLNRRDLYS